VTDQTEEKSGSFRGETGESRSGACATPGDVFRSVPTDRFSRRSQLDTSHQFVSDLAPRLSNRVQISSDGLRAYVEAIEVAFGANVDYAQIVKT
jgi:hypothetical protein